MARGCCLLQVQHADLHVISGLLMPVCVLSQKVDYRKTLEDDGAGRIKTEVQQVICTVSAESAGSSTDAFLIQTHAQAASHLGIGGHMELSRVFWPIHHQTARITRQESSDGELRVLHIVAMCLQQLPQLQCISYLLHWPSSSTCFACPVSTMPISGVSSELAAHRGLCSLVSPVLWLLVHMGTSQHLFIFAPYADKVFACEARMDERFCRQVDNSALE